MALQKCFVSALWSGPAPDGVTVFGRDRIDLSVVAAAKVLPVL